MILDVKEIYLDPKERIRQDYGDVKRMVVSFHKYGQLQAIRVRPPNEGESTDDKKWVLIDGGRRLLAIELARQNDIELRNITPGQIRAEEEEQVDELFALELEYFANEDRKDFDWKERATFIRRIHEGHSNNEKEWSVQHTAALLEMGDKTVYKYLDFFQHPEAFRDKQVQEAATFNVAYKQFQIAKEHAKREAIVNHREKRIAERAKKASKTGPAGSEGDESKDSVGEDSDYVPPSEFAQHICQLGDCREWIKQIPDDTFEWAHWDPPYGGEQRGGAFSTFEDIDDTWVYAKDLMEHMLPDVWRVLKHGSWLVLWYHPQYYHDIMMMLLGHEYDWEEGRCMHCDREWETHKLIGKTCKQNSKWRFWVNPYPNIWFKVDRQSSGQEIRRFLVNAYETFLFASVDKKEHGQPASILPKTDRQNVFVVKQVGRDERRHQMHKPPELLAKILECISIQGEFGFDPSFGSGSIYEAALGTNRKIVGCELERKNRNSAIEVVESCVKEMGLEPYPLDFSL